jgi:hypothetical protein
MNRWAILQRPSGTRHGALRVHLRASFRVWDLFRFLVPTLCVGTQAGPLRGPCESRRRAASCSFPRRAWERKTPPAPRRWFAGLATKRDRIEEPEPTGPVPVVNRFDNSVYESSEIPSLRSLQTSFHRHGAGGEDKRYDRCSLQTSLHRRGAGGEDKGQRQR